MKRDAIIESRQHQGTLDADEIINWVLTVCSMVQAMCQDDAEQQWRALLPQRRQQINFPVQQKFVQFGLNAFLHFGSWGSGTSRLFLVKAFEGITKLFG